MNTKIKLLAALLGWTFLSAPNLPENPQSPRTDVMVEPAPQPGATPSLLTEVSSSANPEMIFSGISGNFFFSSFENQIWFNINDKIRCIIQLSPFRNTDIPSKFSAQDFEKLCDSKPTMYMDGIDFVKKGTLKKTSFSVGCFKARLTPDLLKFLCEHAAHFEQLDNKYMVAALLFWIARKGFVIYGHENVVQDDFEATVRRSKGWERLREQINEISLPGEAKV